MQEREDRACASDARVTETAGAARGSDSARSSRLRARLRGAAEDGFPLVTAEADLERGLVQLRDRELPRRAIRTADGDRVAVAAPFADDLGPLVKPRAKDVLAVLDRELHLLELGRALRVDPAAEEKALLPGRRRLLAAVPD